MILIDGFFILLYIINLFLLVIFDNFWHLSKHDLADNNKKLVLMVISKTNLSSIFLKLVWERVILLKYILLYFYLLNYLSFSKTWLIGRNVSLLLQFPFFLYHEVVQLLIHILRSHRYLFFSLFILLWLLIIIFIIFSGIIKNINKKYDRFLKWPTIYDVNLNEIFFLMAQCFFQIYIDKI